jgi:hypothetical protein
MDASHSRTHLIRRVFKANLSLNHQWRVIILINQTIRTTTKLLLWELVLPIKAKELTTTPSENKLFLRMKRNLHIRVTINSLIDQFRKCHIKWTKTWTNTTWISLIHILTYTMEVKKLTCLLTEFNNPTIIQHKKVSSNTKNKTWWTMATSNIILPSTNITHSSMNTKMKVLLVLYHNHLQTNTLVSLIKVKTSSTRSLTSWTKCINQWVQFQCTSLHHLLWWTSISILLNQSCNSWQLTWIPIPINCLKASFMLN